MTSSPGTTPDTHLLHHLASTSSLAPVLTYFFYRSPCSASRRGCHAQGQRGPVSPKLKVQQLGLKDYAAPCGGAGDSLSAMWLSCVGPKGTSLPETESPTARAKRQCGPLRWYVRRFYGTLSMNQQPSISNNLLFYR